MMHYTFLRALFFAFLMMKYYKMDQDMMKSQDEEKKSENALNEQMEDTENLRVQLDPSFQKNNTTQNQKDRLFFKPAFTALDLDTVFFILLIHTCGADLVQSISRLSQHMWSIGVLVELAFSVIVAVYAWYKWKWESHYFAALNEQKNELEKLREQLEKLKEKQKEQREELEKLREEQREELEKLREEQREELEKQRRRLVEQLDENEKEREENKQKLQSVEREITEREKMFDKPEELLREKEKLLQVQWKLDKTKKMLEKQKLDREKLLEDIEDLLRSNRQRDV